MAGIQTKCVGTQNFCFKKNIKLYFSHKNAQFQSF